MSDLLYTSDRKVQVEVGPVVTLVGYKTRDGWNKIDEVLRNDAPDYKRRLRDLIDDARTSQERLAERDAFFDLRYEEARTIVEECEA